MAAGTETNDGPAGGCCQRARVKERRVAGEMDMLWVALIFGCCVAVAGLSVMVVLSVISHRQPVAWAENPGARLQPCPAQPNCVSSLTGEGRRAVAPFAYAGPPEEAWLRMREVVQSLGGRIQYEESGYLWATFQTTVFRFVDDLELGLDESLGLIHVRSASRVGYSDLGANAKRVDRLHACWAEGQRGCCG